MKIPGQKRPCVRIQNPDLHKDETPDPDPHYGLCRSKTLKKTGGKIQKMSTLGLDLVRNNITNIS
jgi:hypothetical protein